jgi:uridine kinase
MLNPNEGKELPDFNKRQSVFEAVLKQVATRKRKDKAFIVGITGIDCSGKTSFAESLEKFLVSRGINTQLLHLDDYHNPMAYRYSSEDQAHNYFNKSFNIGKIVDELLIPIQQKKAFTTRLTLLNVETDKYEVEKEYSINPDTIVIFEGVFLFRKEFSPYLDLKIFLDISFEECIQRAWKRDSEDFSQRYGDIEEVNKRYEGKYIPAQRKYLAEYPPADTADLIIDNTDWEHPKIVTSP